MDMDDTALAIIGMSGRFPGANTVEALWQNVATGVKSIRRYSDAQLLNAGVDPTILSNPMYVKAGAVVEGIELFDASFFGYTPREAEVMDPQHRLFLECTWEALENAGYAPDACPGAVGIFAGSGFSTYCTNNLYPHRDLIEKVGELQVNLNNERDSLASQVSYKLNLRGPALAVQTFCSTSLVAVHLACQSLITYECDLALAGGVAISVPQMSGYFYEEGGIFSPDGQCRTFDAQANGSVMGNGVGVVVLKRLREALDDGDSIVALIRGSAVNNDGNLRVSYTAPGLQGQAEVIAEALGNAGIQPETVSYIEAHGTGTKLGDAVELSALLKAFGSSSPRKHFCALGSLKPNIGHLDRAAGVAGLIKTALALAHRQLPPSLNFTRTSDDIDLADSPFYVNTSLQDWPAGDTPRRAGVSAFGLGGTNAHVILEEAPEPRPSAPEHTSELLLLSARTENALHQVAARLASHLASHPELKLADVAYTLATGRSAFNYRQALVCRDRQEAIALLKQVESGQLPAIHQTQRHAFPPLSATDASGQRQQIFAGLAGNAQERAEQLDEFGKLWLAGGEIPWANLYRGERRRRVPLPTYPFERRRYWIDPPREQGNPAQREQAAEGKLADRAAWFYQPGWQLTPLPPSKKTLPSYTCWLLFADQHGLLDELAARLREEGQQVIRVLPGSTFQRLDECTYTLRPDEPDAYRVLCQAILSAGQADYYSIVHGWSIAPLESVAFRGGETFQAQQATGFSSLLHLAQALDAFSFQNAPCISVITSHSQAIHSGEQLAPERGLLPGLCKVLAQEQTNLRYRFIDLDFPGAQDQPGETPLSSLLNELLREPTDPVLAYRLGERYTPIYRAMHLDLPETSQRGFRQEGVYLITGGLGQIGLLLASYLVRVYRAKLILVGHTPLPEREQWSEWLASREAHEATSNVIRQVLTLEEEGADLLIAYADAANAAQLAEIVARARQRFGALHGIIHLAGTSKGEAFQSAMQADLYVYDLHFQSKVYALYALQQVLETERLDFCLLFSSLSAILGGLGFAGYACANLFMDSFAYQQNLRGGTPWICIHWDSWQVREHPHGSLGGTIAAYTMTPEEGLESLERVLASGLTCVVNSTGNLDARIRTWVLLDGVREDEAEKHPAAKLTDESSFSGLARFPQRADYERLLTTIWQETLGLEQVSLYDNFFDLGGNSLNGLQVIARMRKLLHMQIPIVALFEAPTVSAMADYLVARRAEHKAEPGQQLEQRRQRARQRSRQEQQDIAIIGLTGRFPGAASIEQFWQNLRDGVEAVTFFSEEELLASGIDAELVRKPTYVKARPILSGAEFFDAAFFGYSPREAELLDPQHRIFLECCWEALERAGYDPARYTGRIGVFGGTNVSSYLHALLQQPQVVASMRELVNDYQLSIGMDKDSLTTAVSYKLNLKGPSLAVQTFCSTSLVAVHLACQSLLNGEADMALAGGVSIRVPIKQGYLYQEGGQESPDGHCRAFDAQAGGCTFGDGAGVVVLKRLSDALEDGDLIFAVIKGSAINNDGSLKVSYSAPSVAGQAEAVIQALERSEVPAERIGYVEAHGSATALGDPIEVAALTRAYQKQTERVGYCVLGSVKTNVGHLDRAAGVTGLIKAVLALSHELIPPTLHFQQPHPAIDFEHSPFYVNNTALPWPRSTLPRYAGVNSLGMGGTNVHLIVEEAPESRPSDAGREWQLLVLSARTEAALQQVTENMHTYLLAHPETPLADIAYTLQVGRQRFAHRRALLCRTHSEALLALEKSSPGQLLSHYETRIDRPVAFLFPGTGELAPGAVRELYLQEKVFQMEVDRCCTLLKPLLGKDLRALLCAEPAAKAPESAQIDLQTLLRPQSASSPPGAERLRQTELAQPAAFVVEYALARLLMQWGLHPRALLGYSIGEYVAACLAGVLTLEDALLLVARRAQLIQNLPVGAMLAVSLAEQALQPYLADSELSLAAINAPEMCVLAGSPEAIARVESALLMQGVAAQRIPVMHAFHSHLLQPIQAELIRLVSTFKLSPPAIPYLSNVSGTWITPEQALDPSYWARQTCQTIRFASALEHLLQDTTTCALLEVGPGQALCSFARQHPACSAEQMQHIFPTLPAAHEHASEVCFLYTTLGKLWLSGVAIDWEGYYAGERRQRVLLPTYPFERQRYWIDGPASSPANSIEQVIEREASHRASLEDWFYLPSWKRAPTRSSVLQPALAAQSWLILAHASGPGAQFAAQLAQRGYKTVVILPGANFSQIDESTYTARYAARDDYEAILKALRARRQLPQHIVHTWTIEPAPELAACQERGFYSLLALAQALDSLGLNTCQLTVVSSGLYDVTGAEALTPANALLTGPCKVLPQEYPKLRCRLIDLASPAESAEAGAQIFDEVCSGLEEPVVALRGSRRWVPLFERHALPEKKVGETPFRPGGVYLITGGLGGIGLALAKYLAEQCQARLVLVGRSTLPARHQWAEFLEQEREHAELARRIRQVRALEDLGAEVLLVQADVQDPAQISAAVTRTLATFGTLHGVFHAAGVPAHGLISRKTPEMVEQVFAPKVYGTLALAQALEGLTLDFLVLFSSLCSITGGGPGQMDYCSASAFLDAFAQSQATRHGMTVAIDWGEWQWNAWEEGLTGYPPEVQSYFKTRRERFGIRFEEGMEALSCILQSRLPRAIVSSEDFQQMVTGSEHFSSATILQELTNFRQVHQASAYTRPLLGTEYVAPTNELEEEIATLWGELLGIQQIGIYDNFFELGGHSLLGTQLIARLRQVFQVDIRLTTLFEAPTVSELALAIEMLLISELEETNQEDKAYVYER